jgi:hypothetical protein
MDWDQCAERLLHVEFGLAHRALVGLALSVELVDVHEQAGMVAFDAAWAGLDPVVGGFFVAEADEAATRSAAR